MKRCTSVAVVLVAILAIAGCAATEFQQVKRDGYRSLTVVGTGADVGMSGIAKLHRNGQITDEKRLEINDIFNKFKEAYDLAVDTLALYAESGGQEGLDAQGQLITAGVALGKFMELANPLLQKYGMEPVKP